MSDRPLKDEVLEQLGDDRLQEIAGLLGSDADDVRRFVGDSVASLTGVLTDESITPGGTAELCQAMEQATAGRSGDGPLIALLGKAAGPAALAVSEKSGLPVSALTGALDAIIPVVASVLADRART
ncbi:DUF937 domain-containing protein [Actinacidiphila oryziradicis]|uniref:DUF937 domain-containing protein n=1 Tax=Actinacidiphila oryziradicis TaxID=2571141 RepID=A0A4U0ST76_9ACTN|nr:DUF937 domain-containing protein [Actinacidiphila oryziradicis]TKA13370.1 hypothetical protein FCI23_01315 [Actinacidiphila oryziradicis]